jgi:hypothetical protein
VGTTASLSPDFSFLPIHFSKIDVSIGIAGSFKLDSPKHEIHRTNNGDSVWQKVMAHHEVCSL